MGSTFAFIDFDYNDGIEKNSASSAYWEIVRNINLPIADGLTAGVQYNDGLSTFGSFGSVWFLGIGYPIDLKFITLNTSLWLRDKENQDPNFQTTIVWFKPFFDRKLVFNGFIDIWGQKDSADESQIVILTEPQIWYQLPLRNCCYHTIFTCYYSVSIII